MPNDNPIAGFLGRILDSLGEPAGTCFQIGDREVVTAWHVVRDIGAEHVGDAVTLDPLRGGSPIDGRVVATDPVHDLALLQISEPLPDTVAGLGSSEGIEPETLVTITGAPEVADSHGYRAIDATGKWQGGVTRDNSTRLARLTSDAVMRGMSGAPVVRHSDGLVVGVISGRYNSEDGWLANSVWVARAEDLAELRKNRSDAAVRRAVASMLLGPLPAGPWCLVLTAELPSAEALTNRVSDVIDRFLGEKPVFDTIHEKPLALSVVDAFRTAENWAVAVEAIARAPYLVADVTDFQPAVMLLLGIRSVVRRGVTISVTGTASTADEPETPFNVQETRVVTYATNDFYEKLADLLIQGTDNLRTDPNYLDLPAYHAVRTPRSRIRTLRLDRPVGSEARTVLMLCPFHPSYGEFFGDLREVILTYTKQHQPVRMLDLRSPRLVGQALYEQIRWSTLCIVDWTHWRANVFFEFGVRLACSSQPPFCIYDKDSTSKGLGGLGAPAGLVQHKLLTRLFGPTTYRRPTVRDDLRPLRDWRSSTLEAPWRPSDAILSPGTTFTLSQSNFVWDDDPFLAMPHVEQQRTIERAVGSNRERRPERPALFADAPAYDVALLRSAKERWIAAWLYLRHLHLDSGLEAPDVAELLTVARRAQNALLGKDVSPRHQRVLDEITAFLDAERAARQRRRIEAGDGS